MKKIKLIILCCLLVAALLGQCAGVHLAAADNTSTAPQINDLTDPHDPAQCSQFQTNENYFFDDYETHDYTGGFLNLHFRLKQPYNDGRPWGDAGFYIYDQACAKEYKDFSAASGGGIAIDAGTQLYSLRFSSATHYDLWNDQIGIKETCSGCSGDLNTSFDNGSGEQATSVSFYGVIDGTDFMRSASYTILPPAQPKTPVLIIPGILGSELVSPTNTKLWPDIPLAAISDDGFLDQLMMDNSGSALYAITVGDIVRSVQYGIGHFDYSSGLIDTLTQQGYAENNNLFVFPYDWRRDPDQLEGAISSELDHIAALNPLSPKIDIIAHSYGGLVLKDYIYKTSDPRIGKIIFVGVPQLGAPEAAQALMFGDDLGLPIINSQEIYKLAQNMPMIYDLLPSLEYYKHTPGFFDDLSSSQSPIMMDYDTAKEMLIDMGKNLGLLNQGEMSHTDSKDNMDFGALPYQVFSLVGCGEFTEKTIIKMYNGDPNLIQRAVWGPKYRIQGDSGDGTVPLVSAIHDGGSVYYISGVKHSSLLSDANASAAIASFLAGTVPIGLSQVADSNCSVSGKLLTFSSNVKVTITNHTTGQILQPRQDYGVIQTGNDMHIFIPQSQLANYEVNVQDETAGDTAENVSVQNINSAAATTTTYNYNGLDIGTANLKMSFPADDPNSQNLSSVNNTTGEVSSVPPSNQQDGSYGDGETADPTATTTSTTTNTEPVNTYTPPANTYTPSTTQEQTSPDNQASDSNNNSSTGANQTDTDTNENNTGSLKMPTGDNSNADSSAATDADANTGQNVPAQPESPTATSSPATPNINVTVNLPGSLGLSDNSNIPNNIESGADIKTGNPTNNPNSPKNQSNQNQSFSGQDATGQTQVLSSGNQLINTIKELAQLIINMIF